MVVSSVTFNNHRVSQSGGRGYINPPQCAISSLPINVAALSGERTAHQRRNKTVVTSTNEVRRPSYKVR